MREQLYFGCTPPEEDCVQVGSEKYNYSQEARKEAKVLIKQLKRQFYFGEKEEQDFLFKVKSNPHDFGSYYEVVLDFDGDNEINSKFAYSMERHCSGTWDDEAKKELVALEYILAKPQWRDL